jgi:TM2 domain-containing membrane protein YozV
LKDTIVQRYKRFFFCPHHRSVFGIEYVFTFFIFVILFLITMMISRLLCNRRLSSTITRNFSGTRNLVSPTREDVDLVGGGTLDHLRLSHSFEPIPYSSDIGVTPLNEYSGSLGHKKVTIVGCGQVGMAIAYSLLNQTTAGTIALVDMNREKLEGEAKDLEQGSAFHQHVRIMASDEYVSIK